MLAELPGILGLQEGASPFRASLVTSSHLPSKALPSSPNLQLQYKGNFNPVRNATSACLWASKDANFVCLNYRQAMISMQTGWPVKLLFPTQGSFCIDEGTKASLLLEFEVLTAPGAARTTALSIKLLCPPSKEMAPQHAVDLDRSCCNIRAWSVLNNEWECCSWEQFCSLGTWNGSSVIQGKEEHNQPSIWKHWHTAH